MRRRERALALAVFIFHRLPRLGTLRVPGTGLALAASLFALAGATGAGLSEAGFLPAEFGRAAALAGFQGFTLLFILACIRRTWEPRSKAKPLSSLPLYLWLAASLALELFANQSPHAEIWSRGAYASRAAWIGPFPGVHGRWGRHHGGRHLRGAAEAGGRTIGLNIGLPHEQKSNSFISPGLGFEFDYFFMRKLWFAHLARAIVVFPGGFGTMDELFETSPSPKQAS